MPTSEPFAFHDEDHLVPDMFPFDFDMENAANDSSLMKEGAYLALQTSDGSANPMFDYPGFGFDDSQQTSEAILTADKSDPRLLPHRGSASSSSSVQSGGSSNSPRPMDTSPGEWLEDVGGNEDAFNEAAFTVEAPVDFSQYFNMSDSGSTPPMVNQTSPEPPISNESLPLSRAVKRRKAQPPKRTKQSPKRLSNAASIKSHEFSPISAQVPSTEPSPTALYASKNNISSPDRKYDAFGGMGVPASWLPATNGQGINPFLPPPPRPDSTYTSPVNHDLSNGNPPASLPHSPMPRLVIHPMPMKSRVETQIPLKITLHNLPKGIKRVHLPTHTIAKPKLLEKPPPGSCADMLELTTMLVCTSAMSNQMRLDRAFTRAARKPNINELSSPVDGLEDEENKPQNGGEVRICPGCIVRERKRAGRKKHKKPEEEELWDRYERERAIVFNTNEVKEWQTVTPDMADPTGAGFINGALPEGTVQVDAPMRIACYCRHHSEKLGFQVIITLKDYTGNIVAQGISSSIMITDDHKTPVHAGPTPTPQQPPQHQHQQSPQPHSQPPVTNGTPISSQASVSQPVITHPTPIQPRGAQSLTSFRPNSGDNASLPFRHAHSTSDLQLPGQSPPLNMSPGPHANIPQPATTATTPQHNFSRQTSPASPLTAGSRKRKASIVGKIPAGLAMTKIETSQSITTVPSNSQNDSAVVSAGSSPYSAGVSHISLNGELSHKEQHILNNMPQQLGASPATPNNSGTEPFVFGGMNHRPMNLKQAVNQLFSAPVSAHPSRAPSPSQLRSDPQSLQMPQRSQEFNPEPSMPPPAILRIIPNEGSKCGGAEITVLGSNFTNDGLEVYFGSQKAITTTFWGPTSLVCMLPPSPVSGPVPVTIKQPGRRQAMQQTAFFIYRDDDEDQLIRTALGVLAGQYGRVVADPADFARSILFAQTSASGSGDQASHVNGNGAFTRFSLESGEAVEASLLRILDMMDLNAGPNRARLNFRRSSGQTMLHLACSLGFVRFVAGLLSRGANLHIKDRGGFTALHMAAMNDHPEVVSRLIAKGADRDVLSNSGLTPMDVARSLSVRRNLQLGQNSFRSRSVDLRRRSRASSPNSARTLWENSTVTPRHRRESLSDDFDRATSTNGDDSSEEPITDEDSNWLDLRRDSFVGPRRRSTVQSTVVDEADEGQGSPSATMAAIREQVATQLQQFQHTITIHLQNLPQLQMPNMPQIPNLPPMPVLPNYQAYWQSAPVMQRISSLVPNIRGQRQGDAGDQSSSPSDNRRGVFPFFGNKDAPPAYEEIFPQKDLDIKQSSAAQAAADFEADAKCAALFDQNSAETSQTQEVSQTEEVPQEVPALLQIGRKHLITKEQQEILQRAHAERLKAGSSDKMLWFVWIPILIFVLGAMLWSGAPSFVSGTTTAAKTLASLIANPRDISTRVRNIIQELA
ncbi:hypothetical protein F4860DRAFT_171683 [Xylaria cubensis]|nr:hypothetical protein F4860DRAFT_171683 [Xylaria cubensis]